MTDRIQRGNDASAGKKRPRIEKLEINKETVEDLTEEQTEAAKGGAMAGGNSLKVGCTIGCPTIGCF